MAISAGEEARARRVLRQRQRRRRRDAVVAAALQDLAGGDDDREGADQVVAAGPIPVAVERVADSINQARRPRRERYRPGWSGPSVTRRLTDREPPEAVSV